MLNFKIIKPILKENNIVVFNIDALLSLFDHHSITKLNDSKYRLAPELCKFLEQKNPDKIYLWSYNGKFVPIISYLESEYDYNPDHTYGALNPVELLDFIKNECNVSENDITFIDYQSNRFLPYQAALSNTEYTRIDPLDFILKSESQDYKESKEYISCYAKEFAECYFI